MFEKAKWIWCQDAIGTDSYTEFYSTCELDGGLPVRIRISADSNYALYINGRFADSGQYADFPHYKIYDDIDISEFVIKGVNHIALVVWYYGVPSFTYYIGNPGVIFEVEQAGNIVLFSDKTILSRQSKRYIGGENVMITSQLGLTFRADLKESDAWMQGTNLCDFANSIIQENMPQELLPRETKKLILKPRCEMSIVGQGTFTYLSDAEHNGFKMQHAALSFYRITEMGEANSDGAVLEKNYGQGIYFIVDLQEETAGYVDFDIEVSENCEMEIGWGEHLEDGRCRTHIAERNFSASVSIKKGRNCYMNPFRRLGCRYVQFFLHTTKVKINYAGVRPTEYPVIMKPYKSSNLLRNKIYEVCCNTLLQCMHEHYEDCPWREQAYYSLDSRNQMLCGYYAFEGHEFPRANLKLIAQSIRDDGILPICYPTNERLTIPSFAISYIMQVAEYYRYTNDVETVAYCFETAKTVVDTFINRIDATGLIPNFDETKKYWNFYEWQPHLNGRGNQGIVYDMCLNAFLSLILDYFVELCNVMQIDDKPYRSAKRLLNENIVKTFYDKKIKLFRICVGQENRGYSVLANALGCLCGAADALEKGNMLQIILDNGSEEIKNIIPATLSMHTFRYEALLREDREYYKESILQKIDEVYFRMLQRGATSFWETEKGDKDFYDAGSLCHGWSAMPIYYYKTLDEGLGR